MFLAGSVSVWISLHGHPSCGCGKFYIALKPASTSFIFLFNPLMILLNKLHVLLSAVIGHMVVPLHPLQRRPDPHQHHSAFHAFHVQDAQHEHEA